MVSKSQRIKELEDELASETRLRQNNLEAWRELYLRLERLEPICKELYYSSHWQSDRLRDETAAKMWTDLKEALDLQEDGPSRIYINDLDFDY